MEKKENQRPKSPGAKSNHKLGSTLSTISNSSASGNNNNKSNKNSTKDVTARERFQNLVLSRVQNPGGGNNNTTNNGKNSSVLAGGTNAGSVRNVPRGAVIPFKGAPNTYPNVVDNRNLGFPRPISHLLGNRDSRPTMAKSMVGVGTDRSRNLRTFVEKAMAEHKVFSCVGVYPAIKNALKKRGWVEKTGPINAIRSANISSYRSDTAPDDESDQAWVSRNLRDYPPDFIWVIRRDNIDWKSMHHNQIINRYPKAWFTTKVGLTACLQNMHWYSEAGFSETFFPRCYRLCLDEERQAFQEDYRLTACMSYLRYFCEAFETKGAAALVDTQSKITPLSIDFASRQLGNYIRMRRHEDIDWLLPPNFMSQHWEAFLHQYNLVIKERRKIRFDNPESVKIKYDMAKKSLIRIGQFWPQAHLDGVYNMWICKPGARSRGKGIVIMNSLDKIMELLTQSNYREANWVVQKYMERPLLVYKTKFDIRQWFVITDWNPLTLWFYKESYVRFCTKPFVLEDFHESIHLCNNAIQCRYQNAESRDSALPDENMWDCYTFQAYLKTIGKLDFWPKIYEGMKRAIIGVLLASQENVEPRRGCFELYGADFMLSEDFNPWLIEINSCPCMAASTSVTARMCAQCLEDTVKVVIDRRQNRNADTGMFEMVYKQPTGAVQVQQFTGHDLVVHGKKLTRDIDWPRLHAPKKSKSKSKKSKTKSRKVSSAPRVRATNPHPIRKLPEKKSNMMTTRNSSTKRASMVSSTHIVRAPTPMLPPPVENLTFADLLQKLRMKNTQLFQGFVSKSKEQTLAAIAGPDPADNSFGTLLNKMRSLSKSQSTDIKKAEPKTNEKVQAISKSDSRPRTPTTRAENSIAYLSKYFDSSSSTFAELARISNKIKSDDSSENDNFNTKPGSAASRRSGSSIKHQNPYLPTGETSKTLEEVRAAVNAASEKYGKIHLDNNCIIVPKEKPVKPLVRNISDSNSSLESIDDIDLDNNFNLDLLYEIHSRSPEAATISSHFQRTFKDETESQPYQSPIPSPIGTVSSLSLVEVPLENTDQHDSLVIYPLLSEFDDDDNQTNHNNPLLIPSSDNLLTTPDNSRPTTPTKIIPTEETITEIFNCESDGNLAQDILNNNLQPFPSSTSSSESELSDIVDLSFNIERDFIPASSCSSLLSKTPPRQPVVTVALKAARAHHHRLPKSKLLCHRMILKPQTLNSLKANNNRRSAPTFPLTKINLKLS